MENEKQYFALVNKILTEGVARDKERTGTGTKSIFGAHLELNVKAGFPLFTHRKIFYKGVIGELISFLRGHTNVNDFKTLGCNYWDEWAELDGNLGPIYGYQWRNYAGLQIDQLKNVIEEAKVNPESRRLYVTAWNPIDADKMALLPCFHGFQLLIHNNHLNLVVNMRSSDVMLGLPSDVLFHALLMLVLSNELDITPHKLIFNLGDAHIYNNHLRFARMVHELQIFNPPQVRLHYEAGIDNLYPNDFIIASYKHNAAKHLKINV